VSLRILQIAPPWFPVPPDRYGGAELVVAGLTDRLVDAGHDVTLLASGGSRTRARLRTVFADPPSQLLGDPVIEARHILAGYDDRSSYDVIHDHTLIGTVLGSRLSGPPVVHTLHGQWTPTNRPLYRDLGQHVSLVAISHDQAARAGDIPVAGVVHNGIDIDQHPLGTGDGGYLAWLGRAGQDKGADVALQVAQKLGRPLRMGVKLNEPDEHAWWAQHMEPHLDDAGVEVIHNADHASKVALLRGASVLLFPIRWDEPFGLVMAEANACGTPVVAFARGAAPEVIADGTTGILVETDDIDGMCAAVERAVTFDRSACRQWVADNFSTERMAAGYLRIYEQQASSHHRPIHAPRASPGPGGGRGSRPTA
jgi:glycosyltransferase involved in cell wall biosynthesis